jgi:hypothetical protein
MTGSKEDLPSAASDARVTICGEEESTTLASGWMAKGGEEGAVLGGTQGERDDAGLGDLRGGFE